MDNMFATSSFGISLLAVSLVGGAFGGDFFVGDLEGIVDAGVKFLKGLLDCDRLLGCSAITEGAALLVPMFAAGEATTTPVELPCCLAPVSDDGLVWSLFMLTVRT